MERAAAGRHAAVATERAAAGCHAASMMDRAAGRHATLRWTGRRLVGHGRVVRHPPRPAIEIAPLGLRPVVRLRGRVICVDEW